MRWLEYAVFILIVLALARPLGLYLARVFDGGRTWLDPVLRPVERGLYRLFGVDPAREMGATVYILSFIAFGLLGAMLLFALLMLQQFLPGGPETQFLVTPMTGHLAGNTALSFATTTTWQAYGGETSLRYLTQMVGLAAQNFLAGAAGLAAGIAFIRGFARENSATLGNFWVDVVRALLWVLLPLSLFGAIALVWQGVPLNLSPYIQATTLEGGAQTLAQGPVAALEFVKQLGTNGGGFFNANGAHPYANPTPLTNILTLLGIIALPAALTVTFGRMTGRPRVGWSLLAMMLAIFVGGLAVCDVAEQATPPYLADAGVVGGNLEGKETRFGVGGSVLAAVVTSNGATGSYNSMHGSYQPIGVLVPLLNMLIGEIAFGGLGTGLASLLMTLLITAFIAALMIGRAPEYLGKKIGVGEARLMALFALLTPLTVLLLTSLALGTEAGRAGLATNSGARGLTEILFAYASSMGNNGQNMAGLAANSPFYNLTTAIAMAAGRFGLVALALALAGRFAAQGRRAVTAGSLSATTPTFVILVLATVILLAGLCFLPVLVVGPVLEHLQIPAATP